MLIENTTNPSDEAVDTNTFDLDESLLEGNTTAEDSDEKPTEEVEETETEEETETDPTDEEDQDEEEAEEDDSDEPDFDEEADEDEDESLDGEEESETDEQDESKQEESKPKPNRFQQRINDLVAKEKAANRRAEELEKRLDAIEAAKQEDAQPSAKEEQEAKGPDPDAKLENGEPKYPLGKYDPDYISDLADHRFEQKQKEFDAKREKAEQQREAEKHREELGQAWDAKLEPAKVKYPDFDEKGEVLMEVVSKQDVNYAEYLATQIMSMDNGPDVLYYLGENPDEATKIMGMGPAKATLELGYLNGKFRDADKEKAKAKPKVSKAPKPPKRVNKGSSVSTSRVAPDTDDLAAFERAYMKK